MNTMQVEILGPGCKKCQQLEANAREAIAALELQAQLVHITDMIEIVKRGVLSTPALRINGKLVSQGQVLPPEQIKSLLTR